MELILSNGFTDLSGVKVEARPSPFLNRGLIGEAQNQFGITALTGLDPQRIIRHKAVKSMTNWNSHLRIAFITSCLEPGRDGVGDYTRRLAGECVRQGHYCAILAANDLHVHEPVLESHEIEGASVPVLRLSRRMDLRHRAVTARQWFVELKPDWLSLQYVCYGYHAKGLPWRWNPIFAELGSVCANRHLMFHELWIGEKERPPLGHRLIGIAQRRIVCAMHRSFRPTVVTTSIHLYQRRLARRGIFAKVLPLFGNIPIAPRDDDLVRELLRAAGSHIVKRPRSAFLNGIFFGAVHPEFQGEALISWLIKLQSHAAKPLLLNMIGHTGRASERLAKQIISSIPKDIEVVIHGRHSEQTISQALQFADFGINTGSPEGIGKSGSFAAMQEHGLPVVLANGELDSAVLKDCATPILQFSAYNSATELTNRSRPTSASGGVHRTAAGLICLYKKGEIGHANSTLIPTCGT